MERAQVIRLDSSPRFAMNALVCQAGGRQVAVFAPADKSQSCSSARTRSYIAKESTVHPATSGQQPRSRATSGPHTCTVCGKTLGRKYELAQHLRKHTGEQLCECAECGRKFARQSDLKRHLRAHSRVYTCGPCGATYPTRQLFTAHRKTHSVERPAHKCQECHKTFSRPGGLSSQRSIHTCDKHYECHICQRRCATRHGLKAHLRAHENIAGLKCNACEKSFLYRWTLLRHIRTHTRVSTTESSVETAMCLEPVPEHVTPDFVWYSNAYSFENGKS